MKTTLSKVAVVVASALSAHIAFAQANAVPESAEQATGQKLTTFTILDRLNNENVVLAAQIQNAKLKRQLDDVIAGKDTDSASGNGAGTFPAQPQMGMQVGSPLMPAQPSGPTVQLVSSSPKLNSGRPTATIALPSGRTVNAVVGTKVPGVGTITLISATQVLYRAGDGHEAGLPFAVAAGNDDERSW
jgi:type IV pilus biogenesis protein PilP